jgi:RNA polymerase sigma-70 factor (ECF subfamily)
VEDADLVKQFLAGRREAFDALVERHRGRVYRIARMIVKRHDLADEATQEAFVKAHQALPRFKGDSRFKTWLHRIAVNAALDLRAREAARSADGPDPETLADAAPSRGARWSGCSSPSGWWRCGAPSRGSRSANGSRSR